MIPETKNAIAAGLEKTRSSLVVGALPWLTMLSAVDLDDKPLAVRNEVQNLLLEGGLESKHKPARAIFAKCAPKDPFRFCRLAPHLLSERIGHMEIKTGHCGNGKAAPPPERFAVALRRQIVRPPRSGGGISAKPDSRSECINSLMANFAAEPVA